jgi:hypothetical protein
LEGQLFVTRRSCGKRRGGTAPGEFNNPTQVVSRAGKIVVLDAGNSRVQILDQRGHFQREIPLAYVGYRACLAVDGEGNIYVNPELDRLQVFDGNGQRLYASESVAQEQDNLTEYQVPG